MKITIIAIGSQGDVQPYIALGKGLTHAGYQVQLVAPSNFEILATQHGLDFVSILPSSQQMMKAPLGQEVMTSGENNFIYISKITKMLGEHRRSMLETALQAAQNSEAIIFNHFGWVGYHIAEKLEIPAIGAWIYPITRTQAFPPLGTPPWLQFGRAFNQTSFWFYERLGQFISNELFKEWRNMLDLPSLPLGGIFADFYKRRIPALYGYSPNVLPKPADWPKRFSVCGYWFLDRSPEWQPTEELIDFLANGQAPVYIGFGSMSSGRSRDLVELAIESLKQTGQRGILAKGWGGLDTPVINKLLTDDIFVIDEVPHDWLFPQMTVVVHHGGAGTTSAGLRAGIPSILIPHSGDQPFWGQQVVKLGVGPTPIPFKKLTTQRLTNAIEVAINDQTIRQNAISLSQKILQEDGITSAVKSFEQFLEGVSR